MIYREGAIGALLDIYEKAIADFGNVIKDIPADALTIITDAQTTDENCKSLQTILTHVVYAGFGYATCIQNLRGDNLIRPGKVFHLAVADYASDLWCVFRYTQNVLKNFRNDELEEYDNALKLKTSWGQSYDIEQMMEHAIVHILRHKRQIEKIKLNQLNRA